MLAIAIIKLIIGIIIYVAGGMVCGKICADIIRFKNKNQSEVLWFWAGCLFNIFAVLLTLVVKEEKE